MLARLLIVIGLLLLLLGVLLLVAPKSLAWFGNLPGDIDIRRGPTRVFIPLTSMLLVSLLLTLLLNLVVWLLRGLR